MNIPNCPKCVSPLKVAEFLVSEDDVKEGLECSNPYCEFAVLEMLGEFLFEDYLQKRLHASIFFPYFVYFD